MRNKRDGALQCTKQGASCGMNVSSWVGRKARSSGRAVAGAVCLERQKEINSDAVSGPDKSELSLETTVIDNDIIDPFYKKTAGADFYLIDDINRT